MSPRTCRWVRTGLAFIHTEATPWAHPPADRVNAITVLEFKQQLPVLKDLGHANGIQPTLDCHAFGRNGVRTDGVLSLFRRTFVVGEHA